MAVADDDIFRSLSDAPAVLVASGFDGDAVVAYIEVHSLYQYVGAGFRVAAVIVVVITVDIYVSYGYVVTEYGVDNPERRIVYLQVFHQYVFATVKLYHTRT